MMTDSDASTMPDPAEQTVIEETEAMLDDSVAQFRLMHTETVTGALPQLTIILLERIPRSIPPSDGAAYAQ